MTMSAENSWADNGISSGLTLKGFVSSDAAPEAGSSFRDGDTSRRSS